MFERREGEMEIVWKCIGGSESCWMNVDVRTAASGIGYSLLSAALVAFIHSEQLLSMSHPSTLEPSPIMGDECRILRHSKCSSYSTSSDPATLRPIQTS